MKLVLSNKIMARTPEDTLVDHIVAQAARPVPAATRARLAQALLDWMTAGWSGLEMGLAEPMRSVARQAFPGPGPAPVFGSVPMMPLGAAFANAAIAHLREIDDAHRSAMLHPGVVAISPVLALAAQEPLSQRQVMAGIVAGYEVALRLGQVLGAGHAGRFHATATAGAVGAAAATGVVLGLPREALHHAMGHAATQAAGLWQLADDGAHEAKSLHPAFAVRNGMMAAMAAQAGLPAARAFFTGTRGMYALLSGDGPLDAIDGGLDAPDRINTATIKAWPSCAMTFTALDALRALMDEHRLDAAQVASVDVAIFSHALKIASVDWPAKPAETAFSMRYLVAALLRHGRLGIAEVETPALDDAQLLDLGRRVTVRGDAGFQQQFPGLRPAVVTVTLQDGRTLSARRDMRRGDPEDPFDWPALQQRMRAFAPGMDDAGAARVTAWCEGFADAGRDAQPCVVDAALFGRPA